MMYEFEDWILDCCKDGSLTKESIATALESDREMLSLWDDYIGDFYHTEKLEIVKDALERAQRKYSTSRSD